MRSARRTSGQATVEFALTIGIVLTLFFAVVDFGRMAAIHAATVTASREAARYGSAVGDSGDGFGTPRYAYCTGIRQAAQNVTGSLVTLGPANIEIRYDRGITLGQPGYVEATDPCSPLGSGPNKDEIQSLDRVEVKVTTTYEAISPIRFVLGPITVVSTDRRTIVK
jgi:Flp pilus assembly protein TadG